MIRAYLDWNIFSNMKKVDKNPYKSINTIIEQYKSKILFPYSPAHLSDLRRGYAENEIRRSKTRYDLDLLQRISSGHCLYFDSNKKQIIPQLYSASDYFDEIIEVSDDYHFESLFLLNDNSSISQLLGGYLEGMKVISTGLDFDNMNVPLKIKESLKEMFPNLMIEDSLYNLLKDISNLIEKPEFYSSIYKSIRNSSIDDMKINTDPSVWGNAFDYLDKVLKKSSLNMTFKELIEQNLSPHNAGEIDSYFDYFIKYYVSLDTFGYYRDSKLQNLIDDATHAFYGAHCDYFVTEDNNTFHKAKSVYENFNISTIVCKPSEFPIAFYSSNQFGSSPATLIDRIVEIINNSLVLMKSVDDMLNAVTVHKVQTPLVDFFNRMQITDFGDSTSLYFYKKRDNYSRFFFWSEIKSIVDKIVIELGLDDNLRSEFIVETDGFEILEESWLGRTWNKGNLIIEIIYDKFGPVFRLTVPNGYSND